MTANVLVDDFRVLQMQTAEDFDTIKKVTDSIKSEFASFYNHGKQKEHEKQKELSHTTIVKMVSMGIKMYSNSFEKAYVFLNTSDIEKIKNTLVNYANNHKSADVFVKEVIADLSKFQKRITINHLTKIGELKMQKNDYEKELLKLEFEKHKMIMDRLSKISWPYDEKTKEYDRQIASLKIRTDRCQQSITGQQELEPSAKEKDILLYRMHFDEKFVKLNQVQAK